MSNNFDILEALRLRRERKRREQKIIEGAPPLTYTAKNAGNLKNYRIYGQTVDGESVGDRTGNLFDWTVKNGNYTTNFSATNRVRGLSSTLINIGDTITVSNYSNINLDIAFCIVNENGKNQIDNDELLSYPNRLYDSDWQNNSFTYTSEYSGWIYLLFKGHTTTITKEDITNIMLNEGSTPLPYEPYGYRVPVTVRGINILPMSTTPISMDVDDFHCEYDGAGTITLTTDKDNAVLDNFSIPLSEEFIIPVAVEQGGDGCVQFNNSIAASVYSNTDHITVFFWYNTSIIDSWGLTTINRINSTYVSMAGKTINRVAIDIKGTGFSTNRKIVIRPAFVLNTTEQVPFEPYRTPVTTPIYLPEQIRKVGDEAEHIDYAEQKQHFADGTSVDVTLPALPTVTGTNVLSVGTGVQPSKVIVKGKISQE